MRRYALILLMLASTGCLYKMGGSLMAGVLDETSGKRGQSDGIEGVTDELLDKEIVNQLGHQLGQGLMSGVADITPEEQASLEATIDGLLAVAASRTGKGLREDVSPELREMVRADIVGAFADGLRGDLGTSLEQTVDRLVDKASEALERAINDPDLTLALADLLRDAIYLAVREGRPGTPGVGETLEVTLNENLLAPFEQSVGGVADEVADQVDKSARRTENTLKTVISALVVILGVFVLMYALTRRQLQRARVSSETAEASTRTMLAAIDQLDEDHRQQVIGKLDEYRAVAGAPLPFRAEGGTTEPRPRSSDYERRE